MEFIYTKEFTKSRKKFPKSIQNKILERLDLLLKDPTHPLLNNHVLNPPWKGYRSINITGDIRLVYRNEGFAYRLVLIGSHSGLYD